MIPVEIPLARCADEIISRLARATGSRALAQLDGMTLLGERAMLAGLAIPGRISAGGGCELYEAGGDTVALNLARAVDRELLPALFQTDPLASCDAQSWSAWIARSDAATLVARGRWMGLAIAAEHEPPAVAAACVELVNGCAAHAARPRAPRVLDLSALWAGPLAAHLLWLAGADIVKVESRSRPDGLRAAERAFYALLNQGKASVALDFADADDRRALLSLIGKADIVIEAARPRALAQLGIDAAEIISRTPGLVWVTITAHGAEGEPGNWVGFGDDCAVAGGLSAALRAASGRTGFVGDAIADPLTGIFAALTAWEAWTSRRGGRFAIAMSQVVARCLSETRRRDPELLTTSLRAWAAATGNAFPAVARRGIGPVPLFGEHTRACLLQT